MEEIENEKEQFSLGDIRGSYFMVMHPDGEDWEQLSVAFTKIEDAVRYFKNVNRVKYPNPRVMLELNCR